MIVLKPPVPIKTDLKHPMMFLAGSIEMGSAVDWQTKVEKKFGPLDGVILNPRRDAWDSSWIQSINNPVFNEQVSWELRGLQLSDIVMFYFVPETMSPVSMMELGLLAGLGAMSHGWQRLYVCCPQRFWRKGNIDIMCKEFDIVVWDDLEKMTDEIYFQISHRHEHGLW